MRKLLIILFILVFCYIQVGYFIHSHLLRQHAKREFSQLLLSPLNASSNILPLHTFSYSAIKNNVQWEEEGREFWYNGQLYDVVSSATINGNLYLTCFNDTKEKNIVSHYLNSIRRRSRSNEQNKELVSVFSPVFLSCVIPCIYTTSFHKKNSFPSYRDNILDRAREILSPPPKS